MKLKWEIDDANVVEAKIGGFGKNLITANGIEIPGKLSLRTKNDLSFSLTGR